MTTNLKTVKEFKERVKEYEKAGENATILKQLTVKERLAVSEMSNIAMIEITKNLKKHIHTIWLCLLLLTFYVVTDCIIELWR